MLKRNSIVQCSLGGLHVCGKHYCWSMDKTATFVEWVWTSSLLTLSHGEIAFIFFSSALTWMSSYLIPKHISAHQVNFYRSDVSPGLLLASSVYDTEEQKNHDCYSPGIPKTLALRHKDSSEIHPNSHFPRDLRELHSTLHFALTHYPCSSVGSVCRCKKPHKTCAPFSVQLNQGPACCPSRLGAEPHSCGRVLPLLILRIVLNKWHLCALFLESEWHVAFLQYTLHCTSYTLPSRLHVLWSPVSWVVFRWTMS